MSRTLALVLAFGGGVATGLLVAKLYARYEAKGGVSDLLTKIGVSRGTADKIGDLVAGQVVG